VVKTFRRLPFVDHDDANWQPGHPSATVGCHYMIISTLAAIRIRMPPPRFGCIQEDPQPFRRWFMYALRGMAPFNPIGNMYWRGVFPTGVPNWKNLKHLFIHSPVGLELTNQMLSYWCNIVSCLLFVNWDHSVVPSVSILLPHRNFLSLQGNHAGFTFLCILSSASQTNLVDDSSLRDKTSIFV